MVDNKTNTKENMDEVEPIYFCYSATLRIFGDICNIDAVSNHLGVKPTHSHKKGESRNKKNSSIVWDRDMWMFESPVPEGRPLDNHIQKLWEIIKPHKDYLIELKETLSVDVFCGYRSN